MKKDRPKRGEKVFWKTTKGGGYHIKKYSVIVKQVKIRDEIAKVIRDYSAEKTMPFEYFWVDFNEIGY